MYRYTFTRGQWSEESTLPDWDDKKHGDYSAHLADLGYHPSRSSISNEWHPLLDIYAHHSNGAHVLEVGFGGLCYEVFIPDFISLMMFLKDYAPALGALHSSESQNKLLEIIKRLFRAYHGHEYHTPCPKCDPFEWKRQEDAAEAREKQRREKPSKT